MCRVVLVRTERMMFDCGVTKYFTPMVNLEMYYDWMEGMRFQATTISKVLRTWKGRTSARYVKGLKGEYRV